MEGYGYSYPVQAGFIRINVDRSVEIRYPYNRNYHAGGPDGLIDGVRGSDNWRLGGWQGYQGTDFEAVIDLGAIEPVLYVGAGFVQEIRSWIWMPVDVTFWISDDGETFREIARIENTIPWDDYGEYRQDLGAHVRESGRYVKVRATNFGRIPDWHLGAGGNAFIFVDEVMIR
jgi:hypothetical protein